MRNQNGMTMIELLIVVAVASVVLLATSSYALPMIAREAMRSATYDVQSFLQLARIEAISRNHDCRFVVDIGDGSLRVLDGMGTANVDDDEELYRSSLPTNVAFDRPDSGSAISLAAVSGSAYQTIFRSDGTISAGAGEMYLAGGDGFRKIGVHAAGGVQVQHWKDGEWSTSW